MQQDIIEKFLKSPTLERMQMILQPDLAEQLKAYMGEPAYNDYRLLSEQTLNNSTVKRRLGDSDKHRLSRDAPENLIFCAGRNGQFTL